jgi:hypothetical protein
MLDKFRDLSFTTKLAVLSVGVITIIALLIGLGLGIRALTSGNGSDVPTPTPSESITESPDDGEGPLPEPSYEPIPAPEDENNTNPDNPEAPNSDLSDADLTAAYFIAEDFVNKFCSFDSSMSYTDYKNKTKSFLGTGNDVSYVSEQTFKTIESFSCEIQVGQPKDMVDTNRYSFVITSTTQTKYKNVDKTIDGLATHNVIMGVEKGEWKVFSVRVSS